MSIFIEGLDLPKKIEPEFVIEFAEGINGKRYVRLHHYKIGSLTDWCEVVSVPPHGDLIDRDTLIKQARTQFDWNDVVDVEDIMNASPIIPAEEGENP